MARIRTIKPELYRHEELFEAERSSKLPLRLAFTGLFTVADREGRFRWQPRVLKLDVLPFDNVDFAAVLDALHEHGFVVKYQVGADTFGHIPTWAKHQHINQREADSVLPAPDEADARTCTHVSAHGEREGEKELEGKGRELEGERESRARDPLEFETFWEKYPHKVGKPLARKAYSGARARAEASEILSGLELYVRAKPPDRQWLNPATFLNQDRFRDEPGPPPRAQREKVVNGFAALALKMAKGESDERNSDSRDEAAGAGRADPAAPTRAGVLDLERSGGADGNFALPDGRGESGR